MKVFFISTHPAVGTGYARVGNKITNYLANLPDVEVVYYAFQRLDEYIIEDRVVDSRIKIYDAIKEDPETPGGFGYNGILPALIKEKPDILFIYGAVPVTNDIMKLIPKEHCPPKKFFYADIVYEWQDPISYHILRNFKFDRIFTFTKYWRDHLINDLGFHPKVVTVLSHGVDFDTFVDVPQNEAKEKMGIKPTDYLIMNMNRNSGRKNWEVTITAFLQLLKRFDLDKKIKLYCCCDMETEGGSNLTHIVEHECLRMSLDADDIFQHNILFCKRAGRMKDSEINNIYNAADVCINTCYGEGFGLITMEHLYFNRPQILSGVPSSKELFGKYSHIVEPKLKLLKMTGFRGILYYCDPTDFTDALEYCYTNREDKPNAREYIKENYSWENVYKVLDKYFIKEK
jgi:glycosyltransferase involved in cell wall biosynthesis